MKGARRDPKVGETAAARDPRDVTGLQAHDAMATGLGLRIVDPADPKAVPRAKVALAARARVTVTVAALTADRPESGGSFRHLCLSSM
jgi:hypothetical protein